MEVQISEKNGLLQCILEGRLDFFRSCSLCSPLPGAYFQDTVKDTIYYSSGINFAPCNGIMEEHENNIPSEEVIDQAIDFFNSRKLPFIWWTSAKNLENKGFQFGGILTGIALDISQGIPVVGKSPSLQLEIRIVQSEAELRTFCELTVSAFGMDRATLDQFNAVNSVAMKQGEQLHFLAYLSGTPVGTATLSTCHSSAGIWNLGTLPDYRKHGIGAALVQAALVEAQKREYNQVMAILMPKGMAWGLFTKLGFKEVCHFPFYVYGASSDELEK